MGEIKTKPLDKDPLEFINEIEDPTRREDCLELLKFFETVTQKKPQVWGNGVVGFGTYHYKSERSAQQGQWMATGFSARKQNITIYIMSGVKNYPSLLSELGKHKLSGGSCIYIQKLKDVNLEILRKLIELSLMDLGKMYKIE